MSKFLWCCVSNLNPSSVCWAFILISCTKPERAPPAAEIVAEKAATATTLSEAGALTLAEDKLVEVFGKQVLNQRPFTSVKTPTTWNFEGTFRCEPGRICSGGVASIKIDKTDGSVIEVSHGR